MSTDEAALSSGISTGPGPSRLRRAFALGAAWQLPAFIVLAALVIGIFTPGFLAVSNIRAIFETSAIVGIVAVTGTLVTLSGNFFSLGTQPVAVLGAVLFAQMIGHGVNAGLCILAVLAVGAVIGGIQGLIVAAGLNPIITTLAVGAIILGAVDTATDSQTISMGSHSVSWLGIDQTFGLPSAVIAFIVVTAVVSWLFAKTVLGRETLLVGANRFTATLSGISFRKVTVVAFVLAGVGAVFAGILSASAIDYANTQFFSTLTFDVVAALLVGGTAIHGGSGSPLRSAFGAVLIAMINNAVLLHQYSTGVQQTVEGVLVVFVILALRTSDGRGAKK